MRIILFQIEIDLYDLWRNVFTDRPDYLSSHNTLIMNILYFDGCNVDTSLFEVGWYDNKFYFEILFFDWIKWNIQKWR